MKLLSGMDQIRQLQSIGNVPGPDLRDGAGADQIVCGLPAQKFGGIEVEFVL